VAEQSGIDPQVLEDLNWTPSGEIPAAPLLRATPRDREEAATLLEEARHAESLGGEGIQKARRIYRGLLVAAGLVESASEESHPGGVDMASDTVARALLGWGRIHEVSQPEVAQLAYRQVVTFFPDLSDLSRQAGQRLEALREGSAQPFADPPPTAIERFPHAPLLVVDIDAARMAADFPEVSLYHALASIPDLQDPKLDRLIHRLREIHEIVLTSLNQLESFHLGVWIDSEAFGANPEQGLKSRSVLGIGKLRGSSEEVKSTLDLGDPEGSYSGTDYYKIDDDLYLIFLEEWGYLGNLEVLREVVDRGATHSHPHLSGADAPYQKMRREVGSGASLLAYLDLEGFLRGPAVAFARSTDLLDEDRLLASLVLAGALGINGISGLALGVSMEEETLSANLALSHSEKGLFRLLYSEPCDSAATRYLPAGVDAMAGLHLTCRSLVEPVQDFLGESPLGLATPVYLAHYEKVLSSIAQALEIEVDPVGLVEQGFASELGIGVQVPPGIILFPNLVAVVPVGDSDTLGADLERVLTRELGIEFSEGESGGIGYRHGILPDIQPPFIVDFSFLVREGMLIAATHPDLLVASVQARTSGRNLGNETVYRSFRDSLPTPDNFQIYLGPSLARQLAMWVSSPGVLAGIDDNRAVLREVVKESLGKVQSNPGASGLGILFDKDRVQMSLRMSHFRSWVVAYLCLTQGGEPVADTDQKGESDSSQP
jgi:hypothetical protein